LSALFAAFWNQVAQLVIRLHSHQVTSSGRLGESERVLQRAARHAHGTGEALVNSVSGVPSLAVATLTAAATDAFPPSSNWLGLACEAERIGVSLDSEAIARFDRFRDLLLARNAQFNLTAIRDAIGVERRLILDALGMLRAIDALSVSAQHPKQHRRLIDVGSGAGFPGLALKIARPELDVTLLDATAKKVAFLDEAISVLELASTRAIHGRAEMVARDRACRAQFNLVTARAVASLPVLLEYTLPFIRVGGAGLFPKGLNIDEELREGRAAAAALGGEVISADADPALGTRLVIVRKTRLTPNAFPRRTGLPSREPLGEGS
jgi:16S rRNA (guanine527-N7)-methyltransferase